MTTHNIHSCLGFTDANPNFHSIFDDNQHVFETQLSPPPPPYYSCSWDLKRQATSKGAYKGHVGSYETSDWSSLAVGIQYGQRHKFLFIDSPKDLVILAESIFSIQLKSQL